MKKIIGITLILLIIAGLMVGCKNNENKEREHQLSKITVTKEPDSQVLKSYNKLFESNYVSLQTAYDDLIGKYNETYDNDILYLLCKSLDDQFIIERYVFSVISNEYIKDINRIKMEYYSEFFNKIWEDNKFNKETVEYHKDFANDLLYCLYSQGMINQSIEFYDKYTARLKDADELVQFTLSYSYFYTNDSKPDKDAVSLMLVRLKTIEKEYYDKVSDSNKIVILHLISSFSYKLNDEKIGSEYEQKAKVVLNKLMGDTED